MTPVGRGFFAKRLGGGGGKRERVKIMYCINIQQVECIYLKGL